jgi:PAS domain-containing protein
MRARSDRAEQLIAALTGSSRIGFAVLDNQFRYQMINEKLSGINGIPVEAHLGVPVIDIFEDIFQLVEVHFHGVLSNGLATHFELANQVLPLRPRQRYWGLNTAFPIWSCDGRVKQLGILVVEITEQRKLQRILRDLSGRLSNSEDETSFWYAHKIQDCLDKYHEVIGVSLGNLIRTPADSMEQMVHSVAALDARLAAMNQLVSEMSVSFPVDMADGHK